MIMRHGACLCAALIRSADGPPVPLPKAFHPHFQGCQRRFTPLRVACGKRFSRASTQTHN